MKDTTDLLVAWLNDAYAMEQHLLPVLQNHKNDIKDNPQAAARLERHIEETRHHAERVKQCLQRLGTTTSATKSALGILLGTANSVSTGMFTDENVKNALTDYAAEQFEVAAYKALATAAREHGDLDIARLCEENMREDQAMAEWLSEHVPQAVRMVLEQHAGTRA